MDTPTTFDELKEAIRELIPGANFDVDEDTEEIIIHTNRREGINGELEEVDEDFDPDEEDSFNKDENTEPLEDEPDDD